jgi:hypothetical protein
VTDTVLNTKLLEQKEGDKVPGTSSLEILAKRFGNIRKRIYICSMKREAK